LPLLSLTIQKWIVCHHSDAIIRLSAFPWNRFSVVSRFFLGLNGESPAIPALQGGELYYSLTRTSYFLYIYPVQKQGRSIPLSPKHSP
jgi:hypothetical protein